MEIVAAAVLGVVQGLTEFLPVSSSAHLVLVPWVLGWKPEGLVFDVALHVGTSVALLAYFRREWTDLVGAAIRGLFAGRPFGTVDARLAWFLALGTIPAVIVGLLFEDDIEQVRSPYIIVVNLTVFGVLLYFAERAGTQRRTLESFGASDAVWVGTAQALALMPGVSRSGITISAGLLRNAERGAAARFSFLLSTPVIVGAAAREALKLLRAGAGSAAAGAPAHASWLVLAVGTTTAAVTGFFCIRYFLRYLQTRSFTPFVIYRFALAAVVLVLYLRQP